MAANPFKQLIKRIEELLWHLEQYLPDPDAGLSLRPEVAAYLEARLRQNKWDGKPLDLVVRELGLDD